MYKVRTFFRVNVGAVFEVRWPIWLHTNTTPGNTLSTLLSSFILKLIYLSMEILSSIFYTNSYITLGLPVVTAEIRSLGNNGCMLVKNKISFHGKRIFSFNTIGMRTELISANFPCIV